MYKATTKRKRVANNKMVTRSVPILSSVCQNVHHQTSTFFLVKLGPQKGAVSLFINNTPQSEEIGAP
jgi:hypothetical protein